LTERIAQSRPQWRNYQEDIKGQIGAALAAEWEGAPVAFLQEDASLTVLFEISGPWSARDAAMPVLIRDPAGHVLQNESARRQGNRVAYAFSLPSGASGPLPWVDVQYPHGQKRLTNAQ